MADRCDKLNLPLGQAMGPSSRDHDRNDAGAEQYQDSEADRKVPASPRGNGGGKRAGTMLNTHLPRFPTKYPGTNANDLPLSLSLPSG